MPVISFSESHKEQVLSLKDLNFAGMNLSRFVWQPCQQVESLDQQSIRKSTTENLRAPFAEIKYPEHFSILKVKGDYIGFTSAKNPVVTQFEYFSVQTLRSLCLCGGFFRGTLNHRDTENAELSQRKPKLVHYQLS